MTRFQEAAGTSKPKLWTIEVLNEDGTWEQLATGKAWRYVSEERAYLDIQSKHMRRWLGGLKARPALIKNDKK